MRKKTLLLAVLAFIICQASTLTLPSQPQQWSAKADTTKTDTVKADTVAVDTTKADTTKAEKPKKETEYDKIVKKGGTVLNGLFTVRHIEDKYYFEVPDSLLGRLILCVNRFTAVPQNFG